MKKTNYKFMVRQAHHDSLCHPDPFDKLRTVFVEGLFKFLY